MQKNFRIAVLLVLMCMTLVALAGCGGEKTYGTILGTVTDLLTQAPVSNAVVTVGSESVKTGPDGKYTLLVQTGSRQVKVVKGDYDTYEGNAVIAKDKETIFDIAMTKVAAEVGTVSGYVTNGRGGAAVAGATVRVVGNDALEVKTSANGSFQIRVIPDITVNLLVEADGMASTRVQDIKVGKNKELFLEVPIRNVEDATKSITPPIISLNILPDAELSGSEEISVTVAGECSTYVIYAYLGGDQRFPTAFMEVESDTGTATVDTTLWPNGATSIKVLAYDINGNAALYTIPVTINNTANDNYVPGNMSGLKVVIETYGQSLELYSDKLDSKVAPAGANIRALISWPQVSNADGYLVYRKVLGETDFTLFATVIRPESGDGKVQDYSPKLSVGKEVIYRVVPYNSAGKGLGMERAVTPLPTISCFLEAPANNASGVSRKPILTWRNDLPEDLPSGTIVESEVFIYNEAEQEVYSARVGNVVHQLGSVLEPNQTYIWDVDTYAVRVFASDDNGYAYAVSIAGSAGGKCTVNGPFTFTTAAQ